MKGFVRIVVVSTIATFGTSRSLGQAMVRPAGKIEGTKLLKDSRPGGTVVVRISYLG